MKYQKRLHWDRHRPEFLKVGFIFALAIAFMAFNYTTLSPVFEPMELEPVEPVILIVPPPTVHEKEVPPPRPPEVKPIVNIEPTSEPIIEFVKKVIFNKEVASIVDSFASEPILEAVPIVEPLKADPIDNTVLLFAERMPMYGECIVDAEEKERRTCTSANLIKHIYAYVKYPDAAREYETEGTVVVSFIVNRKGSVENIEILKDIGMGCGEEVKRVIRKLGQFLPGKQNGRPVAVIYRLPVKFSLE